MTHTEYMRQWRARNKAAGLPANPLSAAAEERKRAKTAEHSRLYRERKRVVDPTWKPKPGPRNQLVRRAGEAVRRAISVGHLVRPDVCEGCGTAGVAIEAAHYNYEPVDHLRVRWLCRPCHRRWDALEPKSAA